MNLNTLKNHKAFTLIEVLVSLFLMSMAMAFIVPNLFFTESNDLDNNIEKIESAIKYSIDEAALKNSIVRIHFLLDEQPQQYYVEFGPDDSLIIPVDDILLDKSSSLKDQKVQQQNIEKFSKQFNRIPEFADENSKLNENAQLIGIGTSLHEVLFTGGEASIYFYPTGEKDSAIIIIGTSVQVMGLIISPFYDELDLVFKDIEINEEDDLEEKQLETAKEIFEAWLKK